MFNEPIQNRTAGLLSVVFILLTQVLAITAVHGSENRPNIIVIYVDDLGFGDVSCYGAKRVTTPNVDKLAAGGLRFTDAHSAASTCTPSRYAMLTGEYAWRRKGTNILPGDASLIISPKSPTLPSLLRAAGYATGVVGKWHLGLGQGSVDWNGEIKPGPLEIGFDYAFLIPATGDRVPCVYVENHHVVGLDPDDPIEVSYQRPVGDEPTGHKNPELLKMKLTGGHDKTIVNGISRIGWMSGGKSARWIDENMADDITAKAVQFIENHRQKPFFLYFSLHDIHVPRAPHERFAGKTDLGPRGDAIVEMDWSVGEIMRVLDEHKLAENTLVIFSSDNGPVLDDGYADEAVKKNGDHQPAGPLRGGKYSSYEGGTRVPMIARWPAKIRPGTSDALLCQVDFPATFAALVGTTLPADAAPDSVNVLPALVGESKQGREVLVEQGRSLALRVGPWKYIPGERNSPGELYDLASDPGETKNLAGADPERLKAMQDKLEEIRRANRLR
jgi:arylsulfatase A-like enzyme